MGNLLGFIVRFGKAAAKSHSLSGKVARGFAVAGTLFAFVPTDRLWVWVPLPSGGHMVVEPTVAQVLGWGVAALALAGVAGVAWNEGRGPHLVIGDKLEWETDDPIYRLRVYNRGGGEPEPEVRVTKIVQASEQGTVERMRSLLSFPLEWSHRGKGETPCLTREWPEGMTLGVLGVSTSTSPEEPVLVLIGPHAHVPVSGMQGRIAAQPKIWLEFVASTKGSSASRWFSLTPQADAPTRSYCPMYYVAVAESPPGTGERRGIRASVRRLLAGGRADVTPTARPKTSQ